MFKVRLAVLGALALFVLSGVGTSVASAAGPVWHVGGTKLESTKQLKLQMKGVAVLKSTITGVAATIECRGSVSEGATIEGQGQAKGTLVFTSCSTTFPNCKVEEPIKTAQTKSRLVTYEGQTKYAELFEPQQGTTFATIHLIKGAATCSVEAEPLPVKGKIAAQVLPTEQEGQEGQLSFPEVAITKVFLEGQTIEPKLALGVNAAKFVAAYGARLATGEQWGVFGQ